MDVAKLICSAHALGWYASALISNIKLWPNLLDEFKGSHIVKKGNVVKDFMTGCATETSKSYAHKKCAFDQIKTVIGLTNVFCTRKK